MPLVECVPNFSEGRDPAVIAAIRDAIAATTGAHVLDVSSDASHNRTVITFVASLEAAVPAALAAMREARERIDLTKHQGEHPRIGATDVVPFIPLDGATMDDCIALARELGERAYRELGIPVVGIETREETPTLSLAKGMRIPVIIGSATSQETLRRAGLRGARAIVAASSHENDNIAISIVAGAIAPEINIVLRAGTDDAINETRSLFHIGAAVDANALTAAMVAHTMTAAVPYAVTHGGAGIVAIDDAGTVVATYPVAAHCNC